MKLAADKGVSNHPDIQKLIGDMEDVAEDLLKLNKAMSKYKKDDDCAECKKQNCTKTDERHTRELPSDLDERTIELARRINTLSSDFQRVLGPTQHQAKHQALKKVISILNEPIASKHQCLIF